MTFSFEGENNITFSDSFTFVLNCLIMNVFLLLVTEH